MTGLFIIFTVVGFGLFSFLFGVAVGVTVMLMKLATEGYWEVEEEDGS